MQTLDDDDALIRAAQSGDVGALEILLDRHHDRIRAVCARVVGSGADADDAAQMALIAIVRNLDRFDGRARFSTWSYRIATNAAIDELRRRKRRAAVSIDDPDAPRQIATPGDLADASVAHLEITRALEQLAEEFRLPVILRDLAGLDYEQIGEILELAPGTVRSRIARGRGKLADLIGPIDPDTAGPGNQEKGSSVQGTTDDY